MRETTEALLTLLQLRHVLRYGLEAQRFVHGQTGTYRLVRLDWLLERRTTVVTKPQVRLDWLPEGRLLPDWLLMR
jgi:hypothetical protein